MKKFFPSVFIILVLSSCEATHYRTTNNSVKSTPPTSAGVRNPSANQTELEYQTLIKTYKSETAAVLTDLLNGSEDSPNTSITVENNSRCNMVLTISGNNYFKKIPIGANKIGSAMVPKNQNYNISGMVCNSVYNKTKFISSSYNVKVSN
ncbi:competence protein ComL [Chryseobacterium gambrini]|uniref:Competence protein ComL n=1 Tax=Chryseobacterium gambrini TaxID=373672 RepID=A0AAJ1R5U8_9FLAO|nr:MULTISPECIES: DUF6759 domain-containing protein [Chryseobacterium]MDN4012849.1 competence protein ComL [Chryseobacterium gambrini]MDN4030642.1 competence protein ComL [Chryseobacterium gambrini]QWA36611.1 competence protein ComL [Chryseobacterium sp. ZHDP1]